MNKEQNDKRLCTVQDLAKYLGVSPYTVRDKVKRGIFPFQAKRLGRLLMFDMSEVDQFIEDLPTVDYGQATMNNSQDTTA